MVAEIEETQIRPHPGPQYQFSECSADIAIFGGAAGPGKSFMLVLEPTRHYEIPGFTAAVFRRTSPELTGAGSVWEEARKLYPALGGYSSKLSWRFPSGALFQFAHCQYEDDLSKHQSKAYCYIAVDELTDFTERMFWFLLSRNRSTCGVKPYFRGATNPKKESFVRELVDWWIGPDGLPILERSGVVRWLARVDEKLIWGSTKKELEGKIASLVPVEQERPEPKSFTFIAAKLEDNPTMTEKDPGYAGRLQLLARVDRERFKNGNWDVTAGAGLLFKSQWFEIVNERPEKVIARVRAWDKAGTEGGGAYTVGALWSLTSGGLFYVEHVIRRQLGPGGVEELIKRTAEVDGRSVEVALWQDPGQAGKADVNVFVRLLKGWNVTGTPAKKDKITYAKPVSAQAEHGYVKVVRGDWNQVWFDEHEDFPEGNYKDQVDTSSLAFFRLTSKLVPSVSPGSGGGRGVQSPYAR